MCLRLSLPLRRYQWFPRTPTKLDLRLFKIFHFQLAGSVIELETSRINTSAPVYVKMGKKDSIEYEVDERLFLYQWVVY